MRAVLLLLATASGGWGQVTEAYLKRYATEYQVPVPLVRAVIAVESGGRPHAVSPKGAVGLMQLMPDTARRFGVTDRFHPEQNISGGIRYLAYLIRQFAGDLRLVLAAYYAGEDRIARRRLAYAHADVCRYVRLVRARYERNLSYPSSAE